MSFKKLNEEEVKIDINQDQVNLILRNLNNENNKYTFNKSIQKIKEMRFDV
jgi:hypothetical protein